MNVERESLIKFGVPIGATLVFIVLVAAVGAAFASTPSGVESGVAMSETGAFALVGLLVVFILGMAGLGALIGDVGED